MLVIVAIICCIAPWSTLAFAVAACFLFTCVLRYSVRKGQIVEKNTETERMRTLQNSAVRGGGLHSPYSSTNYSRQIGNQPVSNVHVAEARFQSDVNKGGKSCIQSKQGIQIDSETYRRLSMMCTCKER